MKMGAQGLNLVKFLRPRERDAASGNFSALSGLSIPEDNVKPRSLSLPVPVSVPQWEAMERGDFCLLGSRARPGGDTQETDLGFHSASDQRVVLRRELRHHRSFCSLLCCPKPKLTSGSMKQWMGTSQRAGEKLGPRERGGGLERGEQAGSCMAPSGPEAGVTEHRDRG